MTEAQAGTIAALLRPATDFHHGDCLGADAQAHALAVDAACRIHLHPPLERALRACCAAEVVYDPLPYLSRNRAIVDACTLLLATPRTFAEERRSGTWACVRYARRVGRPVVVVWPDGAIAS